MLIKEDHQSKLKIQNIYWPCPYHVHFPFSYVKSSFLLSVELPEKKKREGVEKRENEKKKKKQVGNLAVSSVGSIVLLFM